jgi:HPt (histidine-containing phosphotransfer) domain-containing protein
MSSIPESHARVQELLKKLWEQHKGTIFERLATIEKAATSASRLEEAERLDAKSAAHKLAGALGTFGYQQGTEWARESELIFANANIGAVDQRRVVECTRSIRQLLESAHSEPASPK